MLFYNSAQNIEDEFCQSVSLFSPQAFARDLKGKDNGGFMDVFLNDYTLINYPICRLQFVVENFGHSTL